MQIVCFFLTFTNDCKNLVLRQLFFRKGVAFFGKKQSYSLEGQNSAMSPKQERGGSHADVSGRFSVTIPKTSHQQNV